MKSDFIVTENYHVRLREMTGKMLIQRISLNCNAKADYAYGKRYTYQNILLDNVQQLANFLTEKKKDLQFKIPNVQLTGTDSLDIKDRILNMSAE